MRFRLHRLRGAAVVSSAAVVALALSAVRPVVAAGGSEATNLSRPAGGSKPMAVRLEPWRFLAGPPPAGWTDASFDDRAWQQVDLPHDYAIAGPYTPAVSVSMGQLPSPGVVWYRRSFRLSPGDRGKSIFLDIDGAMSYSMVWLNGQFVGGWPYGYASFRLDLTPYVRADGHNVLAIRLDNPVPKDSDWPSGSSRWYAGGGIYRHVWLVKTSPVHVGQWGTYVTTPQVAPDAATVNVQVTLDNDTTRDASVIVRTEIFELDDRDRIRRWTEYYDPSVVSAAFPDIATP